MPDRDDAPEVDRNVARERGELVDRGGDVGERRGPAAAGPEADPPVLDVPGGPASRGEVAAERLVQAPVVAPLPEPAVQDDCDGGRLVALPEEELADLAPVLVPVPPNPLDPQTVSPPDRKYGGGPLRAPSVDR